jgi:hypothetical protein
MMGYVLFHLDGVGEFAISRAISLLDALYAVVLIEVQATAWNERHRVSGSSLPRPSTQKTAYRAAFRHACTLVEDVRTAVQGNSNFLVPVQRLLDRVNRKKGKATALLPVV